MVGIERTDDQGRVMAPAGTNSVVISGGGFARVRVDKTDFTVTPTEITRDLVPIDGATVSAITKGTRSMTTAFPSIRSTRRGSCASTGPPT